MDSIFYMKCLCALYSTFREFSIKNQVPLRCNSKVHTKLFFPTCWATGLWLLNKLLSLFQLSVSGKTSFLSPVIFNDSKWNMSSVGVDCVFSVELPVWGTYTYMYNISHYFLNWFSFCGSSSQFVFLNFNGRSDLIALLLSEHHKSETDRFNIQPIWTETLTPSLFAMTTKEFVLFCC